MRWSRRSGWTFSPPGRPPQRDERRVHSTTCTVSQEAISVTATRCGVDTGRNTPAQQQKERAATHRRYNVGASWLCLGNAGEEGKPETLCPLTYSPTECRLRGSDHGRSESPGGGQRGGRECLRAAGRLAVWPVVVVPCVYACVGISQSAHLSLCRGS